MYQARKAGDAGSHLDLLVGRHGAKYDFKEPVLLKGPKADASDDLRCERKKTAHETGGK